MTGFEIRQKYGLLDSNLVEQGWTVCEFNTIEQDTDKAALVDFGDCKHWIPLSQCMIGVDRHTLQPLIAIKDWLYKKLNL